MRRFQRGEPVVWRSVWRSDRVVGTVWPWVIVEDSDQLIALYRPSGTPGKQRSGEFGGPRKRMLIHWDGGYRDLLWHSVNVLALYRPGDMHSVWRAWDAGTWNLKWRYVNLEDVWRRTPFGFDSKDLYLDLWARPGEDEWHWKDEDELDWIVENGRLAAEEVPLIRAEGERAVDRIRRREPPHDREWDTWRPDPSWMVPGLPTEWQEYEPKVR